MSERPPSMLPVARVEAALAMPRGTAARSTEVYRAPPREALAGDFVGVFAQSFGGPVLRSATAVTFHDGEGRGWDRYGESTWRVVLREGAYAELSKTYVGSGAVFRYRAEIRGGLLVGLWDAPSLAGGLRGIFALRRATELSRADRERLAVAARVAASRAPVVWYPWLVTAAVFVATGIVFFVTKNEYFALAFFAPLVALQVALHHVLFAEHGHLVAAVERALSLYEGPSPDRGDASTAEADASSASRGRARVDARRGPTDPPPHVAESTCDDDSDDEPTRDERTNDGR